MLGPTLVSCDSATPATPAMPEPRPKVMASTQDERTPMARAISRFCDTARTSRPRRVRLRINNSPMNTRRVKPMI